MTNKPESRRDWFIVVALLIAVFGGAYAARHLLFSGAAVNRYARTENQVLLKINEQRAEHGLHPLHYDPKLANTARDHSFDMLRRGYFAHGTWDTRLYDAVGRRDLIAEDLGVTSPGVTGVVKAWMNSPPHRKNILLKDANRLGVGVAVGTWHGQPNTALITADFSS